MGALRLRDPCRWRPFLAAICLAAILPTLHADIFHLKTGGTVDGQLLGTADDQYRIRTVVGTVQLPASAVESIEPKETPFTEYDARVKDTPDTPEALTALAQWCQDHELRGEARRHLLRAIELNPDYRPARRALGYVRVGALWVDGRAGGRRERGAPEEPKETEGQRLVRAIRSQWYRHIRAVQSTFLEGRPEKSFAEGRTRILAIKDPLAILPLADVLSRGDTNARTLLIEALAAFPQDEATMNLAVLALTDLDTDIRRTAVTELVRRRDPRLASEFRRALQTDSDTLVGRAAYALGELKAQDAVPELIPFLTAIRKRWVEIPARDYFYVWPEVFSSGTALSLGGSGGMILTQPEIGVVYYPDQLTSAWEYRQVTVFRTEVLEALRKITGQNFGFDRDEWQRWYATARR